MSGLQLVEVPLELAQHVGLDGDVRLRATDAGRWLMHHDPRVRQREPLARGSRAEQELPHRGGHSEGVGCHVAVDELHGVVDGHSGAHRAAGRIDVQVDVTARIVGRQQQHLGAQLVGDVVTDLTAQEDDPFAQQPLEDGVLQICRSAGSAQLGSIVVSDRSDKHRHASVNGGFVTRESVDHRDDEPTENAHFAHCGIFALSAISA
jgi:hypothetical protein